MEKITVIGLDLAKNIFQVHGANARGKKLLSKKLKRSEVMGFFASQAPCLVGMEACGGAHEWARQIQSLGHDVKLMAPQHVKGFVQGNKTDARDAAGIAEAAVRESIQRVTIDYRNIIGHKVHELTVDIGAYSGLVTLEPTPLYDYTAAKHAKELSQKVSRGMMKKFVMLSSIDSLAFEAAEKTYVAEIDRLMKRVNHAILKANKEIRETNRLIQAIPKSALESAQPGHHRNIGKNGTLSKRGADCIFQLFEAQANSLSVAYLMRISHRSAKHWFAKWNASKAAIG